MKAKKYMERWERSGRDNDTLVEISIEFMCDVVKIGESRGYKSNEDLFEILDEQDSKWREFALLDTKMEIASDGFSGLIKRLHPEVYHYWHLHTLTKKATEFRRQHAEGGCEVCKEALRGR